MLLEDARIGEIVFNPVDRSLIGVRHDDGLATLVRIPYPYDEWNAGPHVSLRRRALRPRHLARRPAALGVGGRGQRRPVPARVGAREAPRRRREAALRVPLRAVRPGELRVLAATAATSTAAATTPACRTSSATRSRPATSRRSPTPRPGFFRPVPLADGRLVVLDYTGEGFVPAIIDPRPIEDVSAITFLGAEVAEKYPVVKTWQVPPPSTVDDEKLITATGPYVPLREHRRSRTPIRCCRATRTRSGSATTSTSRTRSQFASSGITAAYTPRPGPAGERARPRRRLRAATSAGAPPLSWNRSDFYDLFGPTKRSRKGYAAKLGYDWLADLRRAAPARPRSSMSPTTTRSTRCRTPRTSRPASRGSSPAEVGLHYTDVRRSLGAVDDEKGVAWALVYYGQPDADRQITPQLRGELDFGLALPLANSSIWLRTAGGIANGDRNNPSPTSTSAASATTTSTTSRSSATASTTSFPGFGIDEISGAELRARDGRVEPAAVCLRVGGHAGLLPHLAAAVGVRRRRCGPIPRNAALRKDYASVGAQVDLRFSVLHWYDMTLSVGYAVGYQGSQRAGDEWMISLKIM